MQDTIATKQCDKCGNAAPVDAPHFCRTDRRALLRDVNADRVFVDLLAR